MTRDLLVTKRFAFVIEDLYAGGAQKSLLYTAEGLRERGNEVIVFILRDLIEQPIPEKLRIVNLNVVSQFTRAFPWSFIEKWQAHKIKAAVQAFSPDVFISCSCDRITRHIHWPSLYFWFMSDITSKFEDPKKRARAFRRALETYNG